MPSSTRQTALDIRAYVIQKLGEEWEDPNPEGDQSEIEDIDDNDCAIFLQQLNEKVRRPVRPVPGL